MCISVITRKQEEIIRDMYINNNQLGGSAAKKSLHHQHYLEDLSSHEKIHNSPLSNRLHEQRTYREPYKIHKTNYKNYNNLQVA